MKSRIAVCLFLLITLSGNSGCETLGSKTESVTCTSMKFVWVSRKDTKITLEQNAANNGAWVAICGDPGPSPYKKSVVAK